MDLTVSEKRLSFSVMVFFPETGCHERRNSMKKILFIALALFVAVHFFGFDIRGAAESAINAAHRIAGAIIPESEKDFEDIDSQINGIVISSGAKEALESARKTAMKHADTILTHLKREMEKILEAHGIAAPSGRTAAPQSSGGYSFDYSAMNVAEMSLLRQRLIDYSMSLRGISYKFGGETPQSGLDCSGFVKYASQNGINVALPRTAQQMYASTQKISSAEREPGDLVFFKSGGKIDHVGIYLGTYSGSGSLNGREIFINAANKGPRTGVVVSALDEPYWRRHFYSTGRFLPSSKEIAEAALSQQAEQAPSL